MEKSRESPSEHRDDQLPRCQQALHGCNFVVKYFRLLRAVVNALAAADAAFMDDFRMARLALYGLYRAVPNTGVTLAAFVFQGNDRYHLFPHVICWVLKLNYDASGNGRLCKGWHNPADE